MGNCNHKKQYSNRVLMSNPPKISWVCKKCGNKGTEKYTANEQKLIVISYIN